MSRALAAPLSASETKWTVIRGHMTGAVRLMNAHNFTIGRSPECEFVVANDPKISRRHASVAWTARGYEISSLSESNPIQVNGRETAQHLLVDGDVVTIGSSDLQFNTTTQPTDAHIQMRRLTAVPSHTASMPAHPSARTKRRRAPKKSAPLGIKVIYALIAIFVMYLVFGGTSQKKNALQIRGEDQIQEAIENAEKLKESAEKMNYRRLDGSMTAKQAQENYVRGFRDLRKGQYERALDSFNTCLALNPSHTLCNRYKLISQRKFNELVQLQIILGRRYRDQNQFKACQASFRNAMVMIKDVSSAAYREAKANYDACQALAEGRY